MTTGWPILAAGTPRLSDLNSPVQSVLAGLRRVGAASASVAPQAIVGVVADELAGRAGASLRSVALRVFDQPQPTERVTAAIIESMDGWSLDDLDAPFALGRLYELLLAPAHRKRSGAHLTSAAVAHGVVACLPPAQSPDGGPPRVLDPAVGGAAFLLAAAHRHLAAGFDPDDIVNRSTGVDIDGGAVAVAEAALTLWLVQHGRAPRRLPQIVQGDGLLDALPTADLVVGNPPFLSQLQSQSARSSQRRKQVSERWGKLAGAYTDDAWLFLAAGLQALDAGYVAMIQPVSILSARHAAPVRSLVASRHGLHGLWIPFTKVFDAAVDVCAVVVRVADSNRDTEPVRRWSGRDFAERDSCPAPVSPDSAEAGPIVWGPLAAELQGVPITSLSNATGSGPSARRLSDLAVTTAGFRRQFYGLKPHVRELLGPDDSACHRLVTVGMIDPLVLGWGTTEYRFAGDRYQRPVLDLASLAADDPALMQWITARQRPKVLIATQTRVVETWLDVEGRAVPATPVISVEPHDVADLWRLAAALNAPPVTAWLAGSSFGTALSIGAMKFSATDLGALPLPRDDRAWTRATQLLRAAVENADAGTNPFSVGEFAERFGAMMTQAYNDAPQVTQWWLERLRAKLASAPTTQ